MSLDRFVGTENSLASPGWKKPQHVLDAIKKRREAKAKKAGEKNCGASGGTGKPGFQPGNTCAKGGGVSVHVQEWAKEKFGDEEKARKFAEWFGESKAVDENGDPDESEPIEVFHGTTHEFTEFDLSKTDVESHMGAGFYFSSSKSDSSENYSAEGPDLTNRIESLKDRLISTLDPDNLDPVQIAQEHNIPIDHADWIINSSDGDVRLIADRIAVSSLIGGESKVLTTYLKIENPVVIGTATTFAGAKGSGETIFDVEYAEEDESGRSPDDPNFDPDTSIITGIRGSAVDYLDAVVNEAADRGYSIHDEIGEIKHSIAEEGSIRAVALIDKIKRIESLAYESERPDGAIESGDIAAAALRRVGHDGIIYVDASQFFPGMNMEPGTKHYIVWDSKQIKSANDNEGTFDPSNPDITKAYCPTGAGNGQDNSCPPGRNGASTAAVTRAASSIAKLAAMLDKDKPPKSTTTADQKTVEARFAQQSVHVCENLAEKSRAAAYRKMERMSEDEVDDLEKEHGDQVEDYLVGKAEGLAGAALAGALVDLPAPAREILDGIMQQAADGVEDAVVNGEPVFIGELPSRFAGGFVGGVDRDVEQQAKALRPTSEGAANIAIDEQIYSIQFTPTGIRVVGGNLQMCETVRTLCNGAMAEYSPACGSLTSHVAEYAVRQLHGKIIAITEPATELGLGR